MVGLMEEEIDGIDLVRVCGRVELGAVK